jgi:hypothetical protein
VVKQKLSGEFQNDLAPRYVRAQAAPHSEFSPFGMAGSPRAAGGAMMPESLHVATVRPDRSPPVRAPKPGPISGRTARILRSHARHIERLGRRAVHDVIEIGRRLCDAKRRLGHGKFLCWIAHEFGWSERTAENFMRVYDLSCKSEKFADLNLPISALYLLAAPSTPDKALEEVAVRVGNGNGVSIAEVRDIIARGRRTSRLRYLIMTPRLIMDDAQKAAPSDVHDLIRARFAELLGDDRTRDDVKDRVRCECLGRLKECRARFDQLNREIEHLELITRAIDEPPR